MISKDIRTRRQKLQDMANQSTSPHEAEIARKKLEEDNTTYTFKRSISFSFRFTTQDQEFWNKWTLSGFGEY